MAERPPSRVVVPLSFGLGLVGVGAVLAWWLRDEWRGGAIAPLGLGLCFLAIGVLRVVNRTLGRAR